MQADNADDQIITLTGEDGNAHACRVLGIFEFEDKQYALLLTVGEGEGQGAVPEQGAATVLMRLIEKGDQAVFRTIEDDAKFERAMADVKSVAAEMDGES
jgi:uncharacterized protein YrzB (UPF0473 family)